MCRCGVEAVGSGVSRIYQPIIQAHQSSLPIEQIEHHFGHEIASPCNQ
jgi:hypothetical protein